MEEKEELNCTHSCATCGGCGHDHDEMDEMETGILTFVDDEGNVTGNTCIRGEKYGKQEAVDPKRTLTSTVKIKSKLVRRLPVITSGDVPKDKVQEIVRYLDNVEVSAPVKVKDVVVSNVMGLGVDILATRTIEE